MAVITPAGVELTRSTASAVERASDHRITWDAAWPRRPGYRHFMLKEIYRAAARGGRHLPGTARLERGDVDLPEASLTPELSPASSGWSSSPVAPRTTPPWWAAS